MHDIHDLCGIENSDAEPKRNFLDACYNDRTLGFVSLSVDRLRNSDDGSTSEVAGLLNSINFFYLDLMFKAILVNYLKVKKTGTLVHKILNAEKNGGTAVLLTRFSQQLLHRQAKFTCGLFCFDAKLAFSVRNFVLKTKN